MSPYTKSIPPSDLKTQAKLKPDDDVPTSSSLSLPTVTPAHLTTRVPAEGDTT